MPPASADTQTVIRKMNDLFVQFGLPEQVCTDNGKAFTSVWEGGTHQFETFLNERHIEHDLITPYYPESNGKVEALIKIINRECLRWYSMTHHKEQFQSISELQEALDTFVEYYNWYRGHRA
ncbi:MAG: transposase, partial [Gemmatimonadetes bacterium]